MPQDYHKLEIYKEAYNLSVDVFKELAKIQGNFRLVEQINAAATSIFSNVAEMSGYESTGQHLNKILTSIGECNELEARLNHLIDVSLLDNVKGKDFVNRTIEIRKKLFRIRETIKLRKPL
ncbi:MAG: four helix bundle protein [Candidatus Aenigmarchaeota archaeon]|nr:four helix bundle protein [Candidatus Aenigmarchaeota archaeon]